MTMHDPQKTFQGTPCARGHVGIRYRCNGACVDCTAENQARRKAQALTQGAQPKEPSEDPTDG
jgi:hypothetical protein